MTIDTPSNQPYQVLARKYRPQSFDDLIGQAPMVQTLSNAFRLGRIAQAYMLTGVRGVGKTTTARILARALNYSRDGEDQPTIELSEEGDHCRAIMEGRHMDVIEMDAASHTGIDDIRDLIESAQYRPATARYKVYIIDEVHMLSKSAFNGLLKTLEEPPAHLKFIFATTEIRKVPVTVLSRCQRFDLRRIESAELCEHLEMICKKEDVAFEADSLSIIARAAEGSVRDALSMLDQAIAHEAAEGGIKIRAETLRQMLGLSDRARIVDLFEHVMRGDVAAALEEIRSQYETGADPQAVLSDLADFVHLVTRTKYVPAAADDRALSPAERERALESANKLSVPVLGRTWQILLKGINEVGASERGLPAAEMVLVRLTHASTLPTPEELAKLQASINLNNGRPSLTSQQLPDNLPAVSEGPHVPSAQSSAQSMPRQNPTDDNTARAMAEAVPQSVDLGQAEKTINSFDELIFLVEDKRDLKMKSMISRHVRLVSFSDGRIAMNLVENAPRDFLPALSKRLEEWTGKRWVLSVSQEEGSPTLLEQEQSEQAANFESARNDPEVDAIMKQFPGARIVNVKIKSAADEIAVDNPDVSGEE